MNDTKYIIVRYSNGWIDSFPISQRETHEWRFKEVLDEGPYDIEDAFPVIISLRAMDEVYLL